jgi:hypothetical protein
MRSNRKVVTAYRATNFKVAHIIAADPVRYPGLMQEWSARMIKRMHVRLPFSEDDEG